ncbi:MAG: hypothetical protein GTO63_03715 [Anaerolineae bacterium]|nr:hypothetical protein [Anaerolineae bacterium]NIN94122.1 hypothetical protein [Anaerolineae bacterium]NIQ77169.1 hypothetical protein [Anaerolineae bacterium]
MRRLINAIALGMKRSIPMAIAIAIGSLMLVDFFFDESHINALGSFFVDSAVIVVAFALLLGLVNVLIVHLRRTVQREEGWMYSIGLLAIATVVLLAGIAGPDGRLVTWIFDNVQLPLQAATFSLLAFFVATAAYRGFRLRRPESLAFMLAAIVVLLGQIPVGRYLSDVVPAAKDWLLAVPSTAGARGIIIGVALGTIATGVRVLMGLDRPYGGEGGSPE